MRVIFKLNMEAPENRNLLPYLYIWRYAIKQGIAGSPLALASLITQRELEAHACSPWCARRPPQEGEGGPAHSRPTP